MEISLSLSCSPNNINNLQNLIFLLNRISCWASSARALAYITTLTFPPSRIVSQSQTKWSSYYKACSLWVVLQGLVLLSNNHQSSGIFYPNITLPQIGPNLRTARVRVSITSRQYSLIWKKTLQNCQIVIGGEFDIFDDRFHCFV